MLKIAAVKYLNTQPLLNGLRQTGLSQEVQLHLEHPARCAEMLQQGEVDIALCPVGVIPQLPSSHIVTDYCIGSVGAVHSVAVFAHKPLHGLQGVYLFNESRTSNLLVQVLAQKHWELDLIFLEGEEWQRETTNFGQLMIGDRCFELENQYPFKYDLGQAWLDYTGMPFVYAAWVSRRPIDPELEQKLNAAFRIGIENIATDFAGQTTPGGTSAMSYLTENISYHLDAQKKAGLAFFLRQLQTQPDLDYALENSSSESL